MVIQLPSSMDELSPERLTPRVIVLEQGGADRACLILRQGETLFKEARYINRGQVIAQPAPLLRRQEIAQARLALSHKRMRRCPLAVTWTGATGGGG